MSIKDWLVIALACAAGIIGLLMAAANPDGGRYIVGLGLFAAAVVYTFVFLKRHFDRLDQTPH